MHLRPSSLLLASAAAALLASCDPPDENANDPFAQHNKKLQEIDQKPVSFDPPPEIAATFGLSKSDSRAEVVFLQSDASSAYQLYQKSMLTILIGRQSGNRFAPFDAAGKGAEQQRQLKEAVQRKAAAIIIDPVEGADLSASITSAITAGIPVIGLDKHLQGCTTLIYCDPHAIGRAAGTLTVEALKRKAADEGKSAAEGRVVELRGSDASRWSEDVAAGFAETLKTAPGVVLVHDAPADWSADNAFQRLIDAIRIQKQFDVIFAHSDTIARGAVKAANTYKIRENVLIAGVNALPGRDEGMNLLRTGEIDATIGRPPLVDAALQIVMRLRQDAAFKPQAEYTIPPFLITPANLGTVSQNGFYTLPKL